MSQHENNEKGSWGKNINDYKKKLEETFKGTKWHDGDESKSNETERKVMREAG